MSLREVRELVDLLNCGQRAVVRMEGIGAECSPSDGYMWPAETLRSQLLDLLALDRVARAYGPGVRAVDAWLNVGRAAYADLVRPGASQVSGEGEGSTPEREPDVNASAPIDGGAIDKLGESGAAGSDETILAGPPWRVVLKTTDRQGLYLDVWHDASGPVEAGGWGESYPYRNATFWFARVASREAALELVFGERLCSGRMDSSPYFTSYRPSGESGSFEDAPVYWARSEAYGGAS